MQDIHQNHFNAKRLRQPPVKATASLIPLKDAAPYELTQEELRQIVADLLG